jgi:hypothetical protein
MIVNCFVGSAAAVLITLAQWAVFFQPHLYIDSARLALGLRGSENAGGTSGNRLRAS